MCTFVGVDLVVISVFHCFFNKRLLIYPPTDSLTSERERVGARDLLKSLPTSQWWELPYRIDNPDQMLVTSVTRYFYLIHNRVVHSSVKFDFRMRSHQQVMPQLKKVIKLSANDIDYLMSRLSPWFAVSLIILIRSVSERRVQVTKRAP